MNPVITDASCGRALQAAQQLEETQATILVCGDGQHGRHDRHPSSPAAREKALSRLLTLSASVSYTDAVVMAVADEYQTQKICGFDEAFANCGYENIPRWSEAEAA